MPLFLGQCSHLWTFEPHCIESTPSSLHLLGLYRTPQTRTCKPAPQIPADGPQILYSMQGRRSMPSRREAARLPRIAPRTGTGPSDVQTQRPVPLPRNLLANVARTRLPPRSRSGCWTCRRRKVKCDEQRPDCRQCSRLGHECDYNPRLAFKDDLSTAMKRTQDITSAGYSVWNPRLPTPEYGPYRSGQDLLGVFSALNTDEDREKKAQMMPPGTYMVIVNPSSFANLPEYCEDVSSSSQKQSDSPYSHSVPEMLNVQNTSNAQLGGEELCDSNTIILQTFEGHLRRNPISPVIKPEPTFATSSQISVALENSAESAHVFSQSADSSLSRLEEARRGGRDAHLLSHYRSYISERIIKVGSRDVVEDIFEIQSRTFPPLFHAMMAISALSLAHRGGGQSREALDHYVQVVPAMRRFVRSEEDSNSDGALFTHYLLLLYEIASAGRWESNMWQTHSRTLQKIISRRRKANQTEPHGFIVLIICLVDCYAQLSGSGDGAFVDFIMKDKMLTPQDSLPTLTPGSPLQYFEEELPYFPSILELHQRIILLATEVGGAARMLRAEYSQRRSNNFDTIGIDDKYNAASEIRAHEVQNLCRAFVSEWEVRYPQYWSRQPAPRNLPRRVRGFWDHIYTLYRTCVIYSHTSLYPGQMANLMTDSSAASEVSTCATDIIELSRQAVIEERWGLQFIPFSLFLSGVVSRKQEEKALAIKLMTAFEKESYGENTASIRLLLETVYDEQQANTKDGEVNLDVDWHDVMEKSGTRLVMFGM